MQEANQTSTVEHKLAGGSAGGPGENSAECACGTVFNGFDTYAEAVAILDRHIAAVAEHAMHTSTPGAACAPNCPYYEAVEFPCEGAEFGVCGGEPHTPDCPSYPPVDDKRAAFCDGLEQIAAFLREHPEAPLPHISSYPFDGAGYEPTLRAYTASQTDGREQKAIVADAARALGKASKGLGIGDDPKFVVYRKFAGVWYVVQADRDEVCERVVTGTREVTETVPDPEALAAVPTVEVTKVVEDVRWECRPLLGEPATTGGAQ